MDSLLAALEGGRATPDEQRRAAKHLRTLHTERDDYRAALLDWCVRRRDETIEVTERALVVDWEDLQQPL